VREPILEVITELVCDLRAIRCLRGESQALPFDRPGFTSKGYGWGLVARFCVVAFPGLLVRRPLCASFDRKQNCEPRG
jgi:hypothetical protein